MPSSVTVTLSVSPMFSEYSLLESSRFGKLGSITLTVNVLSLSAPSTCTFTIVVP